ncbi:RDD family protein [Kitasatospora sp. NPDC096147]|uniref:RDD family protein n=1 Tax=Kitasatospora sp. NPDC096147 TaxID=3364093 RepID=UPI00381F17F5
MSTHDPSSGPEPEGGDRPAFDKQPPPSGAPADPYGTPPPAPGGSPYNGAPGGSPYGAAPPPPPPPPGYGQAPYGQSPYGGPYDQGAGVAPGMPPLGGWGARIGARVIDYLIVQVVALVLAAPFADLGSRNGWLSAAWITYALFLVYDGVMLSRDGQTVGKKLTKVRVAMLIDGSTPTAGAAWSRAATFAVPALLCCGQLWWVADGLFGVFDKPYRQAVHDKAAKTVVVSTA